MTFEQFEGIVKASELESAKHPKWYRAKVIGFACLGYLYLFLILGLALFLIGFSLYVTVQEGFRPSVIKVVIVFWGLAYLLLRSLKVDFSAPQGIPVTQENAPELFSMIEEVRNKLGAPRIHHVLLDDEVNAYVTQIPKFGMFGWTTNYLVLGLPLLQSISPEQVKVLIGHELAHLSHSHGKTGSWLYRVRRTWDNVMDNLKKQEHWSTIIFKKFFGWYVPRFSAYSFVLARQAEYEADRGSVLVTDSKTAGDLLLSLGIRNRQTDAFYRDIWKKSNETNQPPANIYHLLPETFAQSHPDAEAWIAADLERETDLADTHPALRDRLAAIGEQPRVPEPIRESGAQAYLGPILPKVEAMMSKHWYDNVADRWAEKYEAAETARQKLQAYQAQNPEEMEAEELLDYAIVTEDWEGEEPAKPLYELFLQRFGMDQPLALFRLGTIWLGEDKEAGVAYVKRAMELDSEATEPACKQLFYYYMRNGQEETALQYRDQAIEFAAKQARSEKERESVRLSDTFKSHGVPPESLNEMLEQLRELKELKKAYLVQKVLSDPNDPPIYVLAYSGPSFLTNILSQRIACPGETFIVNLEKNRKLKRPINKIADSLIYQK